MSDSIALIGYSGHGFVVAEAAIQSGMNLKYYTEKAAVVRNPFELTYLGFEDDRDFRWDMDIRFVLGIGDNMIRSKIASSIAAKGKELLNVFHPAASCSTSLRLGTGNFIGRHAAINALVEIDNYCIINTGCIIEHECKIGNSVHIAPGAVLAGNVHVGDFSFVGANSVIKQGITIGSNVIIGAGSVITAHVGDGQKVVGNPGRRI